MMYCTCGVVAMSAFYLFIFLVASYLAAEHAGLLYLFGILLSGFLWIGATALSRHALVRLKHFIGNKVGMLEFLSTQLVALLFPFHYVRLKREVAEFKGRTAGGSDA